MTDETTDHSVDGNGSLGTCGGNSGSSGVPREVLLELGFERGMGCPVAPRTLDLQCVL